METDSNVIEVTGETVTVTGSEVIIAYQQQSEYTDNDILMQLNSNICDGIGLISALIGLLIGFWCARELFKIWLQ